MGLLVAAASAVVETGPATGLADVARRAGVSKGAVQHHFASKLELLLAVVEAGWSDLIEQPAIISDDMALFDRVDV